MQRDYNISCLIMTHNSARTIERCVRSLIDIASEIVVVDDYSSDNTLSILRSIFPDVRIKKRKLNNDFASQRNYAIEQARYGWIVFIDSDEELTNQLRGEIVKSIQKGSYEAYVSRRNNQMMDRYFISTSGRPILFRSHLRFSNALHEDILGVKKGFLKSVLIHHSWVDVQSWISDINRYSSYNAHKWFTERRSYGTIRLLLIGLFFPCWFFFKIYVIERRFWGGFPALLYCYAWSIEWTYSALKYVELQNSSHTKTYKHRFKKN